MNPYLDLTHEFNEGGLRAIVSSGQAVVLLRLSLASKDGDWILAETPQALGHVLTVLGRHGASYRFGSPLDVRWLRGGWSAHLEFPQHGLRIRTDFVTRPPRLSPADLAALWKDAIGAAVPAVDPWRLIALKQTGRERDYAVIGELARMLEDPAQRLLASRSPDDLVELADSQGELALALTPRRPLIEHARADNRAALGAALDAERRTLMEADVARLASYREAASAWASAWPALQREISSRPLAEQHESLIKRALDVLPFAPPMVRP